MKRTLLPVSLFFVSFLYFLTDAFTPLTDLYDEGIVLTGALRILQGDLPYRDFWGIYAPGQFYALAALFKVFGVSLLVERIYSGIIKASITIMLFQTAKEIGNIKTALVSWCLALLFIAKFKSPGYAAVFPAMLFGIAAIYCILLSNRKESSYLLWLGGGLIGVAGVFRHDIAIYFFLPVTLFLMLHPRLTLRTKVTKLIGVSLATATTMTPIFIYLAANIGIAVIGNALLLTPLEVFSDYRDLPYPLFELNRLSFLLVPAFILISLIVCGRAFVFQKNTENWVAAAFLISMIGFFTLNQVRVRSDTTHLLPAALLAILLAPELFSTLTYNKLLRLKKYGFYALACLFMLTCFVQAKKFKSHSDDVDWTQPLKRMSGIALDEDLRKTVLYLNKSTIAQDSIYIGVTNHDQFIKNEVAIYFLTYARFATKYHELHPGITTTTRIQAEMINELKKNNPVFVVLTDEKSAEPNLSSVDTKVDKLDKFIASQYVLIQSVGKYQIYQTEARDLVKCALSSTVK